MKKKWEQFGQIVHQFKIEENNLLDPDYPDWGGVENKISVLDTGKKYIFYTDGMAHENSNVELYLETDENIFDFDLTWQKNLVYETARTISQIEDFDKFIEEYGYFLLQLQMDGAPEEWSLEHDGGNIGIFFGLPIKNSLKGFEPEFKAVNMKLMRPKELEFILKNNDLKEDLAKLYNKSKDKNISNMTRKSVI